MSCAASSSRRNASFAGAPMAIVSSSTRVIDAGSIGGRHWTWITVGPRRGGTVEDVGGRSCRRRRRVGWRRPG